MATVCLRAAVEQGGFIADDKGGILATSGGRNSTAAARVINVYRIDPLRELGSAVLEGALTDGLDFALSPSAARVAVVDDLHLNVDTVRARRNETVTAMEGQTTKAQETGTTPPSPRTPVFQSTTRLVQV